MYTPLHDFSLGKYRCLYFFISSNSLEQIRVTALHPSSASTWVAGYLGTYSDEHCTGIFAWNNGGLDAMSCRLGLVLATRA